MRKKIQYGNKFLVIRLKLLKYIQFIHPKNVLDINF